MPPFHTCPKCDSRTDDAVCPSCSTRITYDEQSYKPDTAFSQQPKAYIDVPHLEQVTNADCSEVVANMIHKWRGDFDRIIPEGHFEFFFRGIPDSVGGRLESGTLDDVRRLVVREHKPVPIRLGHLDHGHSLLVVGVMPDGDLIVHDPDARGDMVVSDGALNNGRVDGYMFEFNGYFVDINPGVELA